MRDGKEGTEISSLDFVYHVLSKHVKSKKKNGDNEK